MGFVVSKKPRSQVRVVLLLSASHACIGRQTERNFESSEGEAIFATKYSTARPPSQTSRNHFFVDGSVSQNHLNVRFNYIENGFFESPLSLNMNCFGQSRASDWSARLFNFLKNRKLWRGDIFFLSCLSSTWRSGL